MSENRSTTNWRSREYMDYTQKMTKGEFQRANLGELMDIKNPMVMYYSKTPMLAFLPVHEMQKLLAEAGRKPLDIVPK